MKREYGSFGNQVTLLGEEGWSTNVWHSKQGGIDKVDFKRDVIYDRLHTNEGIEKKKKKLWH
jgi:hypothetical protein